MDFPSNSHNIVPNSDPKGPKKADKPDKQIEKVVTGEVVVKKKSVGSKVKGIFFGGEFKGAMRYIMTDVMLPALKNLVVDATSKGVERVIYGDRAPRRSFDSRSPLISYNRVPDRYRSVMLPDQPPLPTSYSGRAPRKHEAGEIILATRAEAELVLEGLITVVDKYDVASVADLHDLVGLPTTFVDNNWGWTRLGGSSIRQIREGFLLELPPVEPIK